MYIVIVVGRVVQVFQGCNECDMNRRNGYQSERNPSLPAELYLHDFSDDIKSSNKNVQNQSDVFPRRRELLTN